MWQNATDQDTAIKSGVPPALPGLKRVCSNGSNYLPLYSLAVEDTIIFTGEPGYCLKDSRSTRSGSNVFEGDNEAWGFCEKSSCFKQGRKVTSSELLETGLMAIDSKKCTARSKKLGGAFHRDTEVCAIGAFQTKMTKVAVAKLKNGFNFTTLEIGALSKRRFGGKSTWTGMVKKTDCRFFISRLS